MCKIELVTTFANLKSNLSDSFFVFANIYLIICGHLKSHKPTAKAKPLFKSGTLSQTFIHLKTKHLSLLTRDLSAMKVSLNMNLCRSQV